MLYYIYKITIVSFRYLGMRTSLREAIEDGLFYFLWVFISPVVGVLIHFGISAKICKTCDQLSNKFFGLIWVVPSFFVILFIVKKLKFNKRLLKEQQEELDLKKYSLLKRIKVLFIFFILVFAVLIIPISLYFLQKLW